MADTPDLRELIRISQFAGGDVLLAQGGGGNTSIKSPDGTQMWIKASGLRLAEVGLRTGYLETDLLALLDMMRDESLAALPRAQAQEELVRRIQQAVNGNGRSSPVGLRPSLETTFHAVLGPVVLHTHPVFVNAFTCMEGGEAALAEVIGEPPLWVRYEPPGYALGAEVDRLSREFQAAHGALPDHVLLRNHGFIASAASSDVVMATTERFVQAGRAYFNPLPDGACDFAWPAAPLARWAEALASALGRRANTKPPVMLISRRAALMQAAEDPEQWLLGGPLVPDDAVYNGPRPFVADLSDAPARWLDRELESVPERITVVVRGYGVVFIGPSRRTVESMAENLLAHVLVRWLIAARNGQPRTLPPEEVSYLIEMESEKYRQGIVASEK